MAELTNTIFSSTYISTDLGAISLTNFKEMCRDLECFTPMNVSTVTRSTICSYNLSPKLADQILAVSQHLYLSTVVPCTSVIVDSFTASIWRDITSVRFSYIGDGGTVGRNTLLDLYFRLPNGKYVFDINAISRSWVCLVCHLHNSQNSNCVAASDTPFSACCPVDIAQHCRSELHKLRLLDVADGDSFCTQSELFYCTPEQYLKYWGHNLSAYDRGIVMKYIFNECYDDSIDTPLSIAVIRKRKNVLMLLEQQPEIASAIAVEFSRYVKTIFA
jgi:hypothetical protein